MSTVTNILGMSKEEVRARAEWEMFPSILTSVAGVQPGRPYRFQKFPLMMYRAQRIFPGLQGAGKIAIAVTPPRNLGYANDKDWELACQGASQFNTSCQLTVNDEAEMTRAVEAGWRPTAQEALDHAEAREREVGNITHARQSADRNMSEKAQAEAAAFEADNFGHQPEIPAKPVRKRGRPAKVMA